MPPSTVSLAQPAMSERLDAAQVDQLARGYGRSVFLAAYRVLGNAAQAEDVQQDLFVQLLERPMPPVGNWPAWFATAATRLAIDRLRRDYRWQRLLPGFARHTEAEPERPDQEAVRDQDARWLRRALAGLPRLQAQCFALRHLEGCDVAQIAAALAISPNHVSVNLHRAAQKLHERRGKDAP
jgi:RNA polymerase sigma factor (sigma-70 family)